MLIRQSRDEMTTSEKAILLAVEAGLVTAEEIADQTGAARWWVDLNLRVLVASGFVNAYFDPDYDEPARYAPGPAAR